MSEHAYKHQAFQSLDEQPWVQWHRGLSLVNAPLFYRMAVTDTELVSTLPGDVLVEIIEREFKFQVDSNTHRDTIVNVLGPIKNKPADDDQPSVSYFEYTPKERRDELIELIKEDPRNYTLVTFCPGFVGDAHRIRLSAEDRVRIEAYKDPLFEAELMQYYQEEQQ